MRCKVYSPIGFSDRLRELRINRGLSQPQVAAAIGLERKSILAYENDLVSPNITTLARLSKFYNVTADYLLFGR